MLTAPFAVTIDTTFVTRLTGCDSVLTRALGMVVRGCVTVLSKPFTVTSETTLVTRLIGCVRVFTSPFCETIVTMLFGSGGCIVNVVKAGPGLVNVAAAKLTTLTTVATAGFAVVMACCTIWLIMAGAIIGVATTVKVVGTTTTGVDAPNRNVLIVEIQLLDVVVTVEVLLEGVLLVIVTVD